MNRAFDPIDLASEVDFKVGGAIVRPALRLFAANGLLHTVEPRVMQVLVLLARRDGEVVGHDALVTTCWDGRIVGDDAIQRAIARVRKLGKTSGAFSVETVRKVGYMLVASCATAHTGASAPSPQEGRPSLVVLPFNNRLGSAFGDILVDCMAADLSAAAVLMLDEYYLNVVTASAAERYRSARDPRQIGQELGVHYLLDGTVTRLEDGIRVSLQLVETETGNILWIQKFDRPLPEFPAQQDDLVTELAVHLGGQIERLEIGQALKKPKNASSWNAQKRALAYATRNTRSGCEAAAAEARRATEIDPNDANAYSFLATMLGRLLIYGVGDISQLGREIVSAARQARELDSNNPGVLGGIATALADLGKLPDALVVAKRAVAINANFASGRLILGSILARLDRPNEALVQLDAMEKLSPNSVWFCRSLIWRSVAHLQVLQPDLALESADRAVAISSNIETFAQTLLCLIVKKDWERARDTLLRVRDLDLDLSFEKLQRIILSFNCGSDAVHGHTALIGILWDETSGQAVSQPGTRKSQIANC